MGITVQCLRALCPYLQPVKRVLFLGWPDLLVTKEQLLELLPQVVFESLNDDLAAKEWHRLNYVPVSFGSLARALRIEFDVMDVHRWRGNEIVVDLNQSFHVPLRQYDVVVDHGTIEHCMNVGQALVNCANLTARGGVVMHGSPVNMVNHGFYNISPTLFQDFYRGNRWIVVSHDLIENRSGRVTGIVGKPFERLQLHGEHSQIFIAIKSDAASDVPSWHMQTKYKRKIGK